MQHKSRRWLLIVSPLLAAVAMGAWWVMARPAIPASAEAVPRPPRIRPDYTEIVIPPNIAPLNFVVGEDGRRFAVRIHGPSGNPIEIAGRSAAIVIPRRPWRSLLEANRGRDLEWEVFAETDGKWRRYQTIVNRVAEHEIDGHIVYRLVGPIHSGWSEVAIWQRNLETYEESPVIDGCSFENGCVNCHSFAANDPSRMLVGMRSDPFGSATLLAENGQVTKLATRFGYTAWHPSARIAVYSSNMTRQFFHDTGPELRDVIDMKSTLAYFCPDTRESRSVPGASDERQLATYPAWSPDGKSLYYCRAPMLWTEKDGVPPERHAEVKYSLMRMSYDLDTDRWAAPEMVLSAEKTGRSILLPRVSPDGKFLLFCMCAYGCFPVYQPTSDLYLMDLATGQYSQCPINSPFSESWHSWSSNSRWIAFSSKRCGGTFTRCFLSYVDETGKTHKPLIVPREDPEFYDSFLKTVSVPELVTGAVPIGAAAMTRAARSRQPVTLATSPDELPTVEDSLPYQQADGAGR